MADIPRDLSKRLRGGSFRHAVEAVAALRHLDPASAAGLVSSIAPEDEQRAFQLLIARLVAEGGVHGLAARWRELPSPQWREMLLSEIGQAFHQWVDEGTIGLLLAALEASDHAAAWMTAVRRARIAKIVTAALERCADNPKALTWPDEYIALLGHSATRADQRALVLLEGFRRMAGETRRSEVEALDPENLPSPTSMVAERKGVTPGTRFVRVSSRATGLLDLQGLEEAIERIRRA